MLAQAPSINIYELMNYIYPVNSIYMTVENITEAQMNSKFGGTWEKIKDRFLLASGDTYTNGTTGGEATHTLTLDEIPSHNHYLQDFNMVTTAYKGTTGWPVSSSGSAYVEGGILLSTYSGVNGGSQTHNNMPPYLVVNVFKRKTLWSN